MTLPHRHVPYAVWMRPYTVLIWQYVHLSKLHFHHLNLVFGIDILSGLSQFSFPAVMDFIIAVCLIHVKQMATIKSDRRQIWIPAQDVWVGKRNSSAALTVWGLLSNCDELLGTSCCTMLSFKACGIIMIETEDKAKCSRNLVRSNIFSPLLTLSLSLRWGL